MTVLGRIAIWTLVTAVTLALAAVCVIPLFH
jgi:hypothetical protein